jgi:hypothetical protein
MAIFKAALTECAFCEGIYINKEPDRWHKKHELDSDILDPEDEDNYLTEYGECPTCDTNENGSVINKG